jgi:hypothetical protein
MELRHLRYFVAVAEELHFSRAAARLNIATPTLSAQIQALEAMLGAQLFTRKTRSVALTHVGKRFLEEARATLKQADQAELAGRQAARGENPSDGPFPRLVVPRINPGKLPQPRGHSGPGAKISGFSAARISISFSALSRCFFIARCAASGSPDLKASTIAVCSI